MDSAEFSLWREAYQRNPWGDQRLDWQFAVLNQTIMNMAGKMLKNGIDDPQKLMLKFRDPDAPVIELDPAAFFKQFQQ